MKLLVFIIIIILSLFTFWLVAAFCAAFFDSVDWEKTANKIGKMFDTAYGLGEKLAEKINKRQ